MSKNVTIELTLQEAEELVELLESLIIDDGHEVLSDDAFEARWKLMDAIGTAKRRGRAPTRTRRRR